MEVYDFLRNIEPKARAYGTGASCIRGAAKAAEYLFQLVFRDAYALIVDSEHF